MKIKFAIIYIVAGVAFLAVSLWVFLSNGKSARAIRYKYKLGGIMLTAWAMLSAASCEGPGPFVTCYEPAVTCYDVAEPTNDEVNYGSNVGLMQFKGKGTITISIMHPSFERYRARIATAPQSGEPAVLSEKDFVVRELNKRDCANFEISFDAGDYTGKASISLFGLDKDENGNETERELRYSTMTFTIY